MMKTISFGLLFLTLAAFLAAEPSDAGEKDNETSTKFVVRYTLALTQTEDGIDGHLDLLQDGAHAKPAVVRLYDPSGRTLKTLQLEKTFATIESIPLGIDGRRAIFITQDFGIEFGSYNGSITRILDFSSDGMSWAKARNETTGMDFEISLMRSLKTGWNLSPAKTDPGKDILKASCRFDESAPGQFRTTFTRYHYRGKEWLMSERTENMTWESDDSDQKLGSALPDLAKFP